MKRILHSLRIASIEVFVALLCLLSGLPILFNPATFAPASVIVAFPMVLVIAWALCLVVGGGLNLVGLAVDNPYLRRAGLAMLAGGATFMALSILFVAGWVKLFSIGVYLIFAWACAARYVTLGTDLKARRKRWEKVVHDKED